VRLQTRRDLPLGPPAPACMCEPAEADRLQAMSTMSDWIDQVCHELDLELISPRASTDLVLDLTAEVAHAVARPAAPVTAFLVGLAAGGASDPNAAIAERAEQVKQLAARWGGG
jgi:hypothetical protein